jgi:hypothetical protein
MLEIRGELRHLVQNVVGCLESEHGDVGRGFAKPAG